MNLDRFSARDTNFVKGISVCLLLFHHLFYTQPEVGPQIAGFYIVHHLARLSKVCVALFLLLSGYGLTESLKGKELSLKEFYWKRFSKLYETYWLIWLIFVPLGVFVFGRSFQVIYGSDIAIKAVADFMGMSTFFDFPRYNASWWFISLIILCYFLYPFIRTLTQTYGLFFLLFPFMLMFMMVSTHFGLLVDFASPWLFPFCFGVYLSDRDVVNRLANKIIVNRPVKLLLYLLLLLLIAVQRKMGPWLNGVRIDGLFAFVILMVAYEYLSRIRFLYRFFEFMGRHSFNIFLFHTFIYGIYLHPFINALGSAPLMFVVLLALCLALSMLIEQLQAWIGLMVRKVSPVLRKRPCPGD